MSHHLCAHCRSAPATHFCAQCIRSKYCSVSCQSRAWKSHHFISCRPFYFIEGHEKRPEPSLSDEELEVLFQKMVADGAPLHEVESVFGQMSEAFRERNESLLPCHEDTDPISLDPIVDLPPDNRMYLMIGAIKYCFAVDGLYMIIRDNPRANNPLTRAPLSNVEYGKIQEAAAAREEAEENRVYEEGNDGSFYNLIYTYQADLEWDRIPYEKMSPKYIVMAFNSIEDVKQVSQVFEPFLNYISSNRNFWYWFFRDVLKERHEDESEDLIALGLILISKTILKVYLSYFDEQRRYVTEIRSKQDIPVGTTFMKVIEFDPIHWQIITTTASLEHLDMSNLNLTSVPSEIGDLTLIRSLDLSQNKLKQIPKDLGKLHLIEHLYLDRNNLVDIPVELFRLYRLRWLDLRENYELTREKKLQIMRGFSDNRIITLNF